jgi:hypothetical protein
MAKLTKDTKVLIVQRLATFTLPSAIVAELKEQGVEATIQQVVYYDPSTKGTDLAPQWRELFAEARAGFIKDTSSIAIAHKAFRLQELSRMYQKAMSGTRPNLVLAQSILEQAAKEMGEAYTNRRQLVSPNPLADLAALLNLEPAQLAAALSNEGIET